MEHTDWLMSFGFPYINFFIFAGLLFYLARKPLRSIALRRKEEYESLSRAAREAQEKAQVHLSELNKRLQQLDQEVNDIRLKAQKEAEAEAERIVLRGKELAEHIQKEAHRIAEAEVLKAKEDLRAEVLASVKAQVEHQILLDFNAERQLQYVREKAANLPSMITRA